MAAENQNDIDLKMHPNFTYAEKNFNVHLRKHKIPKL